MCHYVEKPLRDASPVCKCGISYCDITLFLIKLPVAATADVNLFIAEYGTACDTAAAAMIAL